MNRRHLASLGIQVPVLPTLVLGGLPGEPTWAPRLHRIGIDVLCSGASPDTHATLATAREVNPVIPVKAIGPGATLAEGAWLVEDSTTGDPAVAILPEDCVIAQRGVTYIDPNECAAMILDRVSDDPARWWIVAEGLGTLTEDDAQHALEVMVEATRYVRLYLSKRQFET